MKEKPPDYYQRNGIECVDAMRPFVERLGGSQAFCVGSILKYLWRFGTKPETSSIDDLRKVIRYVEMLIEEIEN